MAFIFSFSSRYFRLITVVFVFNLLYINISLAQVFPVQVNINVTPPYSVYLSQYTAIGQEKVMVTILLRDPVIPSLDVKFRFTIEGGGIILTTNPAWNPQPFNITGGITAMLPQEIIADYLKPQNLLIEGVNLQDFYRSGKLPEGFYEFKVEVIEYRRGVIISNTGRTGLWLLLNEPPRIVFPLIGQKVKATNPQMLNFTWVPGGVTSPLSNLNTMYEFTLVELFDKNIDPYIAITTASNASKFVKILDQTSLFYGPAEMQITPGKTYAIRVKAYNTEGFELFKNGGYSDVRTFTFGDACPIPLSFILQSPRQSSFDINIITDPANTSWQARFRESSDTNSEWSELKSEPNITLKTVNGLKPKTTYEVQVKALCGDISSEQSHSQTISTSPMADANRVCNVNPTPFAVDNVPPLTILKENDIFFAALFPVRVKQIKSQVNGMFSGRGIATLPLFNTGLAVTFENININSLMQLTSGHVVAVRDELNMTLFGDTQTTTGGNTGGSTGDVGGNTTIYPPITDTVIIPSVYDSLVVVNDSTVIIYPPNGGTAVTVNLGGSDCTLLIPADRNMDNAQIVYDGAAHPYKKGQESLSDDPKNFKGFFARFKAHEQQTHGYDTLNLKQIILSKYYKQLTIADKQFYLPWKALKDGMPEPVKLFIKQGTDKLPFATLKVKQTGVGDLTPSIGGGTATQTFLLSGSYKGLEESVVAYYNVDSKVNFAGGLYTATYGEKRQKLILIPFPNIEITDATRGRLINELNLIYSQAVVSWNVELIKDFKGIELGSNGLDWARKEMLSSYNAEMNSVISAFKEFKPKADPDAYYLFVVPNFSESSIEGFMPRNRRFGFITQAQLDGRLIAHEVGHGAFNLKHTFSPDGWNIKDNTDNLMDYTDGINLWKPQWDLIHNPEVTSGLLYEVEEGASIVSATTIDSLYLYLETIRIQPNSYKLITATPEMPDIRIKPFKNNYADSAEIEVRLKIEYKRWNTDNTQVRNDSTFYPATGWQKVKINEIWDIDFGTEMRGGKAYVYYKSGNVTKSEIFYMRGTNPTEQEVRTYLTAQGYNEWFLMKIIREESVSTVVGQAMKQFNPGTNYGTAWSSTIGCPNMGYPRGFGLMQLDNFGTANGTLLVANPNQLWNWKANIDRGVQFLRDDKIQWAENRISGYLTTIQKWNEKNPDNIVNDSINIERGDNTGSSVLNIQEGNTTNNETIAINPTGTQRSIQHATALKYYNGGAYCTLRRKAITNKPYWTINRLNNLTPPFNYVERVCSRNP
ncbi:MAG: fibronectin type III domain-containing protein [Tenuifilaceae bacterium]